MEKLIVDEFDFMGESGGNPYIYCSGKKGMFP